MIKDVIINVKGVQGIDDQTDTVELTTEGRFGIKNCKYYLSYEEGQLIENGLCKTKIYINSSDSVVLQRKGAIESRMEIEKDKRNVSLYVTPVGELSIGIYGEKVEINLNESGGSINLAYTIDSDLRLISRNTVEITVKEVEKCQ